MVNGDGNETEIRGFKNIQDMNWRNLVIGSVEEEGGGGGENYIDLGMQLGLGDDCFVMSIWMLRVFLGFIYSKSDYFVQRIGISL